MTIKKFISKICTKVFQRQQVLVNSIWRDRGDLSPFPPTHITVVIEVLDGWVRHQAKSQYNTYPINESPIKYFLKIYKTYAGDNIQRNGLRK